MPRGWLRAPTHPLAGCVLPLTQEVNYVPPLTHGLLAVEDLEATVHAGCQEQMVVDWVPLEPPYPSLHGCVC